MTNKQIWQTIALDLKRAANYQISGRVNEAKYFLDEAKYLYKTVKKKNSIKKISAFLKFSGEPEDILLTSSLIQNRI